ncbi:recombinase family protein [Burkholderia sp. BCC0405]|uniref:recombinase family protein n=1 Tax=Burkholderia sp. BCC0405 TaxID=2676298 RepID=UPI00158F449C|nr:recombinase family protein [Burkholderia sp. BCC0405]
MKAAVKARPVAPSAPAHLYVYGRFSSVKQAKGDSLQRQMDYARHWADQHGFVIDESLTMFDHGLSAYKGDHVKRGALGVFLKAIESGRVLPGSVLVVESLDRLSRAEPMDAQEQFGAIVRAGVTIVTANDGLEYSRERLKHDPSPLFLALATMIRAHQESASKGERVASALYNQCVGWTEGTWRGQLNAGNDPSWVRYNKDRRAFELDPHEAERMRALIGLYCEGHAPLAAFKLMHERGIPMPKGIGNTSRLHATLRNRSLVGERIVDVKFDDKLTTFTLKDYYPPLMSDAEFASLQHLRSQRGRRPGQSTLVSILTGIGITVCAHCGAAMVNQNIMSRPKQANGRPQDGHRRLVCVGRQKAADVRCVAGSCSIVPIERALMAYCSDQMNLASLFENSDSQGRQLRDNLALARQAVIDTEGQIKRFYAIATADSGEAPASLLSHMRDLDNQLTTDKRKVAELEHEIGALDRHSHPAAVEVWAALREGVEVLDETARTRARQLIMDTFSRIEVSLYVPDQIGLRLISKRGVVRILWIDRKSGARRDQLTVEDAAHAALRPPRRR